MTVEASKICGAVVAVALGASPVAADVSSFCTKPAAGPATLGFDVRPSMVVNAPAVLDVTRGDLGLGGTAGERAFSFSRTVAAILDSAGAPSDAAAQQAFVQTMLDGFSAPPRYTRRQRIEERGRRDTRRELTEAERGLLPKGH